MSAQKAYKNELEPRLRAATDYEAKLDLLRIFTREKQKAIRDFDLTGGLPLTDLFEELTALAEAVLRGSLQTAWNELKEYSRPSARPRGDFIVVAMGKFGGRELTYRSDLDIVFLYENAEDQEIFSKLATRVISALSLLTRQGTAYAVDTALRPSGNRGTLVSSIASFQEYHRTIGRTWERQALIKAHPLFGLSDDGTATRRVRALIEDITYQDYDPKKIAAEIAHLRGRMESEIARERPGRYNLKTGRGGLVDVEFAAQFLQLAYGSKHPKIRTSNTISALQALAAEGILEVSLAETWERSYLFLRGVETRLRLVLDQPADDLVEGAEWLKELESRFYGGERLIPQVIEARESIRSAYERVMRA